MTTSRTQIDTDDLYSWHSKTRFFDEEGNLSARETLFDDGTETMSYFAPGWKITEKFVRDGGDVATWDTKHMLFGDDGIEYLNIVWDTGRTLEQTYANGRAVQKDWVDGGDQYHWHTKFDTYEEDGKIAFRAMTLDNGQQVEQTYENGQMVHKTIADAADDYGWEIRYIDYLPSGDIHTMRTLWDDGRESVIDYTLF